MRDVCPSTVLGLVTPLLHGFVDASVSGKSTAALWTAQAQLFSDIHQLIENQEECLPHLQGDSFTLENPQPSHFKEEEEYPQPPYFKEEEEEECLLAQEEADLSKFPLTVVSVKTEEHEDKPPESSQLHHSPMCVPQWKKFGHPCHMVSTSKVYFPTKTMHPAHQPMASPPKFDHSMEAVHPSHPHTAGPPPNVHTYGPSPGVHNSLLPEST
ncbi:uncharacterized protein LOC133545004 isoform X2 [Nerophis ophidion]|uniref:uncharacterized protein LOC133545004 isoform X2 n=1 Tax=Nerophis ophidion TaxID=159077 RepID=UPI002ADF84B7|nr:uncharacterized protein LOC133545004 isoform X2 [Nerophis ophidion]